MPVVLYERFDIARSDFARYRRRVISEYRRACPKKLGIPVAGPRRTGVQNWIFVELTAASGTQIVLAICADTLYLYAWRRGGLHSTDRWIKVSNETVDLPGGCDAVPFSGNYSRVGDPHTAYVDRERLAGAVKTLSRCEDVTHPPHGSEDAFLLMIIVFCAAMRVNTIYNSVQQSLDCRRGGNFTDGDTDREKSWHRISDMWLSGEPGEVTGYGTVSDSSVSRHLSVVLCYTRGSHSLSKGDGWKEKEPPGPGPGPDDGDGRTKKTDDVKADKKGREKKKRWQQQPAKEQKKGAFRGKGKNDQTRQPQTPSAQVQTRQFQFQPAQQQRRQLPQMQPQPKVPQPQSDVPQPEFELYMKERVSAEWSTEFEDLHQRSQNVLAKISESRRGYVDESEKLDRYTRLYDSYASDDRFEVDAAHIIQEIGGTNTAVEREKASSVQQLVTSVKDMIRSTRCRDSLKALPKITSNVHDYFTYVSSKVEKLHQYRSVKTAYLIEQHHEAAICDIFGSALFATPSFGGEDVSGASFGGASPQQIPLLQLRSQKFLFQPVQQQLQYVFIIEDLHQDCSLKIKDEVWGYRDESGKVEECTCLYDSCIFSDSFEIGAAQIVQEIGGTNDAIEREMASEQQLVTSVKDMICGTELAIHTVERLQKFLEDGIRRIDELQQLVQIDANRRCGDSLRCLPRVMSNVHDYFVHVALKDEKLHRYIDSMKSAYLIEQRRCQDYINSSLEVNHNEAVHLETTPGLVEQMFRALVLRSNGKYNCVCYTSQQPCFELLFSFSEENAENQEKCQGVGETAVFSHLQQIL